MQQQNAFYYLKRYVGPAMMAGFGFLLTIRPDSATVMMIRLVGIVLVLAAVGMGISLALRPGDMALKITGIVIFALSGIWMLAFPLSLASWFGRLIGILLIIQGVQSILALRTSLGLVILPVLTVVTGVVLTVLPLSASRLVFRILGIAMMVIGIVTLVYRAQNEKQDRNGPGSGPDIIDAL